MAGFFFNPLTSFSRWIKAKLTNRCNRCRPWYIFSIPSRGLVAVVSFRTFGQLQPSQGIAVHVGVPCFSLPVFCFFLVGDSLGKKKNLQVFQIDIGTKHETDTFYIVAVISLRQQQQQQQQQQQLLLLLLLLLVLLLLLLLTTTTTNNNNNYYYYYYYYNYYYIY